MRDEIQRISKLVAEGKLSPEDAADLIDAFYASERVDEPVSEETSTTTPPPPPPDAPRAKDPLKTIIDHIEKLTKEGADAVNWTEVSQQARQGAKKGLEALRSGIEDISKGKINIDWLGLQETKEISLPITVPEGKTLRIENACGDVKVSTGATSGTVSAKARFRGSSIEEAKQKASQYTLIIEESDHVVNIRQPDVGGLSVDLEVKLTTHAPVEIKTQSGDIDISNTGAGCRVNARSGDIRLMGLNGPIEINSESGDIGVELSSTPSLAIENKSGHIRIARVKGNMNVRTASGDVHVLSAAGKVMALESISGGVRVDLEEPVTGSLNVRTVNGNATIGVADGSDCRVSLSTLRGNVSCNLPLEDEAKANQRITGRLGAGTGTLDVSAVTGNIMLELRDHQTANV